MRIPKLLIGADPELFIQDFETGEIISAHDKVPGTKQNPVVVPKGAIQCDGTAAEFNIIPARNVSEFVANIQTVVSQLDDCVKQQNKTYKLVAVPTAVYTKEYFDSLPPTARLLGCDPDFDAWNAGKQNESPKDEGRTFRTGGGHIHLGWTEGKDSTDIAHFHDCIEMTKQLDAALYPPSLLFDKDRDRRSLYGKKGAFRPKDYGVEYRSLSNAWLKEPELCEWVYQSASEAWHMLDQEENKLYAGNLQIGAWLDRADELSEKELVDYCKALVDWGFPPLPPQYMEV